MEQLSRAAAVGLSEGTLQTLLEQQATTLGEQQPCPQRRAFVADGQAYNGSIQRGSFADFVPIVDLLHVVCYLFKASLVGEFNAWVKGKQKFWNRPAGAEAVRQVRAGLLSEDGRLERYFAQRPGNPYRRRAV
jgi:hypothetical protein